MGLHLCRDQRKTNLAFASSDLQNDDHLDTNRLRQNTQSANIGNILKTMETNQHDSYLSVDAEMKPASVSMESPDEMGDDHISTQFSGQKKSHLIDEAEDLVSSAYPHRATSEERNLGKNDNMNKTGEVVLPIDDWGKEAETVLYGSEDLLCTVSVPLLKLDEQDLIPELKQCSSDAPVAKKIRPKKMPSLYRPTSSAKWTANMINRESDAIRKELNHMLEEVEDDSTFTEESPTSLETSISSDGNEDAKQDDKSTCLNGTRVTR